MNVKFLGTSAGWPLPRLGCHCRVCSSKDPKDIRRRSQALVNGSLLLDIGIDTYHHLSKPSIDPTNIKYAAITHEHPDHTFGLWDLGHIYNSKQIKVIIHETTYKKIKKLFFYKEYDVVVVKNETPIKLRSLEVSLLPVNHTDSSFGVFVKEGDESFFWAPDFKTLPEDTKRKLRGSVVAQDGSELNISTPNHQTIIEGIKLAKEVKAAQIYFIHIGHRTLPNKQLVDFVKQAGGNQFDVAYDNLEIEI